MWSVEDIEASAVELDFSSSGRGRRAATAVSAAGIRLFNAIFLLPPSTQGASPGDAPEIDMDENGTQLDVTGCHALIGGRKPGRSQM
jgi:hypothetical protein